MSELTPELVERRIEEAGRDLVFARAHALGCSGMYQPLWVWNQICLDLIRERSKVVPPLPAIGDSA